MLIAYIVLGQKKKHEKYNNLGESLDTRENDLWCLLKIVKLYFRCLVTEVVVVSSIFAASDAFSIDRPCFILF